jgi:hypothetical protein
MNFEYMRKNPVELTYLGIGSVFRCFDLDKLTPELDQVYPVFLREFRGSFRAIHYDPRFAECWNFLDVYFSSFGLKRSGDNVWMSEDMTRQFVIYSEMRDHDQDYFHELSEICMRNGKLIVQEYTGKFLNDLFLQTYYSFSPADRSIFRRRVTFDMTCGDASCMTDMSKTFPMIDSHGDFLNFMLIPPHDLHSYINKNERLDNLIQTYYRKEYKKILNEEHTNYRRRINGDPCLFPRQEYTNLADACDIFEVLTKKLDKAIQPLKNFGFPVEKYNELILNYRNYDMYKWYTLMNNL